MSKAPDTSKAADRTQERPEPKERSDSGEPSQTASITDRKVAERPTKPPASGKPAARPSSGTSQAGLPDAATAGADGSQEATADGAATTGEAEGETPAGEPETGAETAAATPSAISAFVVPPTPAAPPQRPLAAAKGSPPDGALEIETGVAAADSAGASAAKGAVAVKPGFDAALAAAVSDGAADAAVTPIPEPSAAGGAQTAPTSPTDTKAAPATQPQGQAAQPDPVPLGQVPMTIGLRALGASNRFEIRLDPKELGRIDVSLDIDTDTGTVGARLVVDRPETLALLQRDASSLQQALSQTGLDASAGISLSLRGGEGENRRSNGEPGAEAQARGAGQTDHTGPQAGTDPSLLDLVPLRALRGLGRVDLRI